MESVESKLGYYPKCPHCKSDKGYDVTMCPHTVGAGGFYEIVSCQSCHTLVHICYPPIDQHAE